METKTIIFGLRINLIQAHMDICGHNCFVMITFCFDIKIKWIL